MNSPQPPLDPRRKPEPQPTLRPTRITTLVLVTLVVAFLAWWLTDVYYGDLPPLTWFPSLTVAAIALLECAAAVNTKARLDRKPGTEPVQPLVVARFVALAKASALLGAVYVGGHAGFAVWVYGHSALIDQAKRDTPVAIIGVCAGVLLAVAALWLEHACRVPKPPRDDTGASPTGNNGSPRQ